MSATVAAETTARAAANRLTPSQRSRRDRILAAALELAAKGGFDGVQMRDVATEADVALGTLYRYFASKEYLLASVMHAQVEQLATYVASRPASGATAQERVISVLGSANRAFLRYPEVSVAQIRALVSGNQELAPIVVSVTDTMRGIIRSAIGEPDTDSAAALQDDAIADTLFDVWLAALVGWISGVHEADGVQQKLERTIRLVLPD